MEKDATIDHLRSGESLALVNRTEQVRVTRNVN